MYKYSPTQGQRPVDIATLPVPCGGKDVRLLKVLRRFTAVSEINVLRLRGQKGFTLIEIILVLIIIGLLASIAAPRYYNLQEEAKVKVLGGVINAFQSTVIQGFALHMLQGKAMRDYVPAGDDGLLTLGDFTARITNNNGVITITVIASSKDWWSEDLDGNTRTFTLY